jgi:hypothetical protein
MPTVTKMEPHENPAGQTDGMPKTWKLGPGSSGTAVLGSGDRQSPGPEEAPGQRIMLTFTTYPRESGWQSALALGQSLSN